MGEPAVLYNGIWGAVVQIPSQGAGTRAKLAWREGRMGHAELVVTRFPDTNRGLPRIVEMKMLV